MNENRVTIICWKCREEFSKHILKENQKGVHVVVCPFCGIECKIEFELNNNVIEVFKSKKVL